MSWSGITCRPYRAKDVRWIPSYKHFAPMALRSATTPTLNTHAICGSKSVATDAAAAAETEKIIGSAVKLARRRRWSELQQ